MGRSGQHGGVVTQTHGRLGLQGHRAEQWQQGNRCGLLLCCPRAWPTRCSSPRRAQWDGLPQAACSWWLYSTQHPDPRRPADPCSLCSAPRAGDLVRACWVGRQWALGPQDGPWPCFGTMPHRESWFGRSFRPDLPPCSSTAPRPWANALLSAWSWFELAQQGCPEAFSEAGLSRQALEAPERSWSSPASSANGPGPSPPATTCRSTLAALVLRAA